MRREEGGGGEGRRGEERGEEGRSGEEEEGEGGRVRFLSGSVGGLAGVPVVCYSWQGMPQWLRTSKVCLCICDLCGLGA